MINELVLTYAGIGYSGITTDPKPEAGEYNGGLAFQAGVKFFHQMFFADIKYRSISGSYEGDIIAINDQGYITEKGTLDWDMSSILISAGVNF